MNAGSIRRALAGLSLAPAVVAAQKPAVNLYSLDVGHSVMEFSIGFAFSRVKGRFTDGRGTIAYDPAHPENSSVTVVIPAKSIDTGWPHRDEHLRTSDFFDVETFPKIVFQSTRLRPNGKDWLMDGQLTMHGVTKPMTLPLVLPAPRRSPESGWMILNATSAFKLARKDFNITGGSKYNAWFNAARMATMSDTVDVSLEMEGWWQDAEANRSPGILAGVDRLRTQGVSAQMDRLRTSLATYPESTWMNYFTGTDFVVRELLEVDRTRAAELVRAMPAIFKGMRAHAVYAHALSVSGDTAGARKEYAEAKRVYKPRVLDPNEKFPQDDDQWYWLDNLVLWSLERGHLREARTLAAFSADLFPEIARAQATYGWTLALGGDAKGADAAFARGLRADPFDTRTMELKRRSP